MPGTIETRKVCKSLRKDTFRVYPQLKSYGMAGTLKVAIAYLFCNVVRVYLMRTSYFVSLSAAN